MNKWVIILGCVIIVLAALVYIMDDDGLSIHAGSCIAADNGRYLIVSDGSPIAMSAYDASIFNGLKTGDKILIASGSIRETYPAQTNVKYLFKIGSGGDISDEIIQSLKELGWMIDPLADSSFRYPLAYGTAESNI